jgi:hypothetical protein
VKTRSIITAAVASAAAVGLAVITPLVASAHVAAPAVTKHVYSFTSLTKAQVQYGRTGGAQQDTDVNAKGKTIGFDTLSFAFNPMTGKGTLTGTVVMSGGFLYLTGPLSNGATTKGSVTGGTGALKGTKGTFVAKNLNAAGTKTAVTITYYL